MGLALLFDPVTGIGLPASTLGRDLRLAAELGLDSHLALNDPEAFRSMIFDSADSTIAAEYTEIPIDHEDPSLGTYRNRFWVNEEFYVPESPIMVYDIGEATAEYSVSLLANSSSWLGLLLHEFRAMGVVWEHRYYGDSLPFPVSQDMPVEHMKYLTTKQALADIPYFAAKFSRTSHPDIDLTPRGTPWVMIGGSYPGIRAAFTRNKYPDTIFAAYASSAPVQAQIDMSVYYEQIYRAMVANGYSNCTKDIQAALKYIDDQLSNEETSASIKRLFLGPDAEKNSNGDFTTALGALYGPFQAHGIGSGNQSLHNFCNYLELDPATNQLAGSEGLAPIRGSKYVAERWASFPYFISLVNRIYGTNCDGLNASEPLSCDFSQPNTVPELISWTWQYCTEWGFFQSNNFGSHALLSSYQTLEYQQELCYRQFPNAVQVGLLPPQPQTESLNEEFGGWTIRPSNVYFSGGQFDPWRPLSVLSDENWAPPGVNFTTEIPACGVSTGEEAVFGYIMENAVHCPDFQLTPDAAVSRDYFIQALKQWLPCFRRNQSGSHSDY
ncbi:thymus-specific serine protease [Aspergillus udagawae]|uniref:Thymus-specific serine protease n=1 Tax=Aspergillus udagawae TaxID=91492 RepID=A0ABQ1ARW7_9EURO|nr:thymus-specific serine protease [Aspergillus udagawae]GFF86912.1 thymus-specific serine protease [Aspergillus udagawae]GFG21748.1 thymus-specific serine protease [Aspergillus udagawae]